MPDALCFHCGLPVNGKPHYLDIRDKKEVFCCAGCQMVANTIIENGLLHYYDFRANRSPSQINIVPPELLELSQYDLPDIQQQLCEQDRGNARKIILSIDGITCAACIWLLEKRVRALSGVTKFTVNLTNHRAELRWCESAINLSQILLDIAKIGYRAQPYSPAKEEGNRKAEYASALKRLAISGFGFGQVMMFAAPLYSWFSHGIPIQYRDFFRVVSLLVTTPVLIYCGRPFFESAYKNLRTRMLSMDVSISFALIVVYVAGLYATIMRTGEVYFDSITMFLFFITLSRYLEMRARHRSNFAIQQMTQQQPIWITRVLNGVPETIAVSRLKIDDHIIVNKGMTIPVDGVVCDESASVDESLLTGESLPKIKYKGNMVAAGSVNVGDPLWLVVTRVGSDTTLASIIKLNERAQFEKPKIISYTQKVSHYFVLVQLLISVIVFLYWLPQSLAFAFWSMISLLVISCPCALAVATPVALTSAMNALSRIGFFCTRGHVLESLSSITDIVFDKTGTLTEGRFFIRSVKLCADLSEEAVLAIAAALEMQSEHPIASAFKQYDNHLIASNVKVYANCGVQGVVNNHRYQLGNESFACPLKQTITDPYSSQDTIVYLTDDSRLLAVFYLQDKLRAHAISTVRQLAADGYRIHLLSGDVHEAVEHYARTLHIENYHSSCSPSDKLDYIKALQQQNARVLMIGDGINDAPVLMQAQVSVAMASGADLARISADAVIMNNDVSILTAVFIHAKKTQRVIRQCLMWAIFYNLISLPLAVSGMVAPYVAAILMSLSSLLVVGYALRLLHLSTHSEPRSPSLIVEPVTI